MVSTRVLLSSSSTIWHWPNDSDALWLRKITEALLRPSDTQLPNLDNTHYGQGKFDGVDPPYQPKGGPQVNHRSAL